MANQSMNLWQGLSELNAVLVKEVRQMVRSRLLLTIMGIELFALGITCFIFLVLSASDSNSTSTPESGRYFFIFLVFILGVAQGLGAVDLLARALKEREPGAVDLLFITTLTPGQIVRGKFWAGLGINLLVVALGLPFLALSYLLRGLDLPTILLGTVYLVSLALILVAGVLAVASLPLPNLLKKYGFGLAMVIGVLWATGAVCAGLAVSSSMSMVWLQWKYLVLYLGTMATLLWGLGGMARFLLAAPTSDRSGRLRLVMTFCGIVWGALMWFAVWRKSGDDFVVVLALGSIVLHALPVIGVALALFCNEIIQSGWRRQKTSRLSWLSFPFYEGTVNGVVWSVLMVGIMMSASHLIIFFNESISTNFSEFSRVYLPGSLLAYGYLFCYALTARAFCDWLQLRWQVFFSPILAFVSMLGGAGLLMVLVVIIHEAFDSQGEITWPFLGNIMAFVWEGQRNEFFYFHVATIVLWLGVLAIELKVLHAKRRRLQSVLTQTQEKS